MTNFVETINEPSLRLTGPSRLGHFDRTRRRELLQTFQDVCKAACLDQHHVPLVLRAKHSTRIIALKERHKPLRRGTWPGNNGSPPPRNRRGRKIPRDHYKMWYIKLGYLLFLLFHERKKACKISTLSSFFLFTIQKLNSVHFSWKKKPSQSNTPANL